MSQRWWLVGVAIVGVVMAVLLVPRPDTGVDIPDADPANTRPLDFKAEPAPAPPAPAPSRPRVQEPDDGYGMKTERPEPRAEEERNITPEQQAFIDRRNAKNPTAARAMVGPIGGIRRQLHIDGSDEAKALIARFAPVQAEMSEMGQHPDDGHDLDGVVMRMDSVIDDVKSSKWYSSDPMVKSQVDRYEAARDAWRAAE